MQVKVRFTGIVRHYAGDSERSYEMPEGARVIDLLTLIGKDYGARMPGHMWDEGEERFHPLIKATRRGSPVAEDEDELRDGDEIFIISRMAGG